MSVVYPTHVNPIVNPLVGILNMPAWPAWRAGKLAPQDAILHWDASKNEPLLPVTYNGKYLVVKNV